MRRLLLSDILIRFCERIPYAWVVIFAMDYIGVSGEQVGVLTTIEMLAATLCIIPSLVLRRPIWARALRHRHFCHVHVISDLPAHVAEFFRVGSGVRNSRSQGIRRYFAQGTDHRLF